MPITDYRFGRAYPCPKCNQESVIRASGLNPQERTIKLDALKVKGKPGTAAMVESCRDFIAHDFHGFLSLYGNYGNGKTTALKALVNVALSNGIEARYMTMTEVMVYAREAFESQQQGDTDYGRIARLASTRLLCIDELDKARLTAYATEVQTHLFDVRYRNAEKFGTVVAWNGDLKTIPLPWVMSRLSQYPMVENKDADMRPIVGG